ncbi:DUF3085 domain-containing protein [Salmonella enterica]|nr:DUF3085 domain-containing protein [Salmonella enterica]EBA5087792.1 DUF3085 domain-containing protein [Salmonella enterica]EDC3689247.1 DUF3085 domain-containing protein [Salmonella enterica]EIS6476879.1 DUF3085 domain-containing protein [Salmonella enterica]EIS6642121.1 DUF3085 domain-containing protein [Salmonella enterica]
MMSEEGATDETGRHLILSYAEGFNPEQRDFDEWYYELHDTCGGDDFGETISAPNMVFHRVLQYREDLEVAFTPTQYAMVPSRQNNQNKTQPFNMAGFYFTDRLNSVFHE